MAQLATDTTTNQDIKDRARGLLEAVGYLVTPTEGPSDFIAIGPNGVRYIRVVPEGEMPGSQYQLERMFKGLASTVSLETWRFRDADGLPRIEHNG